MNVMQNRWNYVYKLWKSYLAHDPLPQFDKWLAQEFSHYKKFGKRDRKWYSEILFAGIRFGYFALACEELFQELSSPLVAEDIHRFTRKYLTSGELISALRNLPAERIFIWICLRYSAVAVNENHISYFQFKDDSFLQEQEFYNHVTLIIQKELDENLSFQLLYHGIPQFYSLVLQERVKYSNWDKKQLSDFLYMLDFRPPLWIRLNDKKHLRNVLQEFEKEGFSLESRNAGLTIKITGEKTILNLLAYQNGFFEIQDLASQNIGEHIQIQDGQFVWDACAGGGGKTLQLASYFNNRGAVYASDIRTYKLEELKRRAHKAGFNNILCLPWEGKQLPLFLKEIEENKGFDWVLVDAPCSSSGTWRRNPDAKCRLDIEGLKKFSELQLNLLQNASFAVRAGGNLVYSTCSWTCEENEAVVRRFLQSHLNFALMEQKLLGSPAEDSDTMFVAVLKKSP